MQFFQPDIPSSYLEEMMELGSYVEPFSIANAICRFYKAGDAKGLREFYDVFERYKIRESAAEERINAVKLAMANMHTYTLLADWLAEEATEVTGTEELTQMLIETSERRTGPVLDFFCDALDYHPGKE
jgi:hypothetical protein